MTPPRLLPLDLRTDFRLPADSGGSIVNAMMQGSVLSMCRSGICPPVRLSFGGWLR